MKEEILKKFLEEVEKYAKYNINIREIIKGYLESSEDDYYKKHNEKEICFLNGRIMGLYMTAMTLRKILNLEIPNDENYQIYFSDVLK